MLTRRTMMAALCAAPFPAFAADPSPTEIVAAVDALRLPPQQDAAWKSVFRITDGDGATRTIDKVEVLVRGPNSRVLMLEGQSRGMKFLSTPQGFWMYAPNTRRAMRLTPQQTLRGSASVGDISRLRFADDYASSFASPATEMIDGRACWVVSLKAKSQAATYSSVLLKVAKSDMTPVSADVFAISGKKLKTVLYGRARQIGSRRGMFDATYVDGTNPARRTVVEMLVLEPSEAPAGMFRPEALPTDF